MENKKYNTEQIVDENNNALIDDENLQDVGEKITSPFSPNDIKISNPPMNLGDLIDNITYGYIDFDTEYQREGNLWEGNKPSRLIESIMLGLRLPAFYFEEVIPKKKWKIIDGLQRCWVIKNFCVDKKFALKDLEFLSDFEDETFDSLALDIKRDIRSLPITVNVLDKGAPDQVKFILFKRLNSGGVALTDQEVRNAVFQGKVIDAIREMSRYQEFLNATVTKIPTKRKQSEDFISRFVAFYVTPYTKYEPDLDKFINGSLSVVQKEWSDLQISEMKTNFKNVMILAKTIFGNDAFRKRTDKDDARRPLNKAYFEVISNTFAKLKKSDKEAIVKNSGLLRENLITLMNNKTYSDSFSGGTGRKESVIKRFSWFEDTVSYSINNQIISIGNDNKIIAK